MRFTSASGIALISPSSGSIVLQQKVVLLTLIMIFLMAATLQVIATVTLAAYVALGGLGQYIITGIALRDYTEVLAGAILVTALALVVDGVFALVQRGVLSRVSPRTDRAFNATLIS